VFILLLIAAGVTLRFVFKDRQLRSSLQSITDELDANDPNWRLEEIEETRAAVTDAENSARVVPAVRRLLPSGGWPSVRLSDALENVEPQEQLRADQLTLLSSELDSVAPALAEARKLAGLPRGRYPITYAPNPINTLLNEQQNARTVAALLAHDARRLAQQGDPKAALASCRAALNTGRSLGDEPLGISQLIRTGCVALACWEIERVLAQGEPADADLAAVQQLLDEEERFPTVLVTLRGERAMQHELYQRVEKGEASLDTSGTPPPSGLMGGLERWSERRLLRYEQPFILRSLTGRVEVARRPPHEQRAAMKTQATEEKREVPSDAILTRLLVPSIDKLCQAAWRKQTQLRCLAVLVAVERFRQANGRWPVKLDDLKPRFLKTVPLDPFDGKPLRYRRLDDGVIVYSVGPDEKDNGGVLDRKDPTRAGADLGYRLWDVERRRQPPRPIPPAPKGEGQ
jgi:hypothetical protein